MSLERLFDLSGKTALVTGASSGIGHEFACSLAEVGARVIAVARRQEKLEELADRIQQAQGQCVPIVCDVTSKDQIHSNLIPVLSQERIDILVNNAGVLRKTPVFEIDSEAKFEEVIQTNLLGAWYILQHIACHMRDHAISGSIINVGSICGELAASPTYAAYSASKAALMQLTHQLVTELSPYQIRINCIAPGMIRTDMVKEHLEEMGKDLESITPLGFIGKPTDLVGVLLFLASNEASRYVTGTCVSVDGGLSWV